MIFISIADTLASEFAKTIKPNGRSTNETIVYGTVVKDSESVSVQIDGSDTRTPIATTADVEDGERVTVLIKDHQAVVTGNASSPSARNATVQAIDDRVEIAELALQNSGATIEALTVNYMKVNETLIATNARLDNIVATEITTEYLEANYATIKNLEAVDAKIEKIIATEITTEYLEANYATIQKLTAAEGRIDTLESNSVTTEYLTANYATIKKLEATNATVENLEVKVAKIDDLESNSAKINTLLFGSASGNVIQTSFSNSVIAQLGDAQIKSAMIQDIAASKITAGTIYTDDVTIQSKNGQMILSDNTILISDGTRARVQIGKDASGDYSINVWDASGNLMFSKGGITDKAIKSAIIRDDMVSEKANISAGKLDISSLFTEINKDGSNVIKSNKIYFDEQEATLDVCFKSMELSQRTLTSQVSSLGTQIEITKVQINSKIWQQDITTAVDSISVGGKNLIQKANVVNFRGTTNTENFIKMGMVIHEDSEVHGGFRFDAANIYEQNTEYVLSGYISLVSGTIENFYIFNGKKHTFKSLIIDNVSCGTPFDTEVTVANHLLNDGNEHYFELHFITSENIPDDASNSYTFIQLSKFSETMAEYKIRGFKLEKGNKATDWTPAPEDINNDIITLTTKYSMLEQNIDGFKTTVAATYTTISDFNSLNIGARNRLLNSAQWDDFTCPVGESIHNTTGTSVTPNEVVTVSYDVKAATEYSGRTALVQYYDESRVRIGYAWADDNVKTEYTRHSITVTIPENAIYLSIGLRSSQNVEITYRKIKIESGNKATDWTPAPEDIYGRIDDISVGVTNLLRDTKTMDTTNGFVKYSATISIDTDDFGYSVATLPADSAWDNVNFYFQNGIDDLVGKEATLSFDAKSDGLTLNTNQWVVLASVFTKNNIRVKGVYLAYLNDESKFNTKDYVNGEWVRCKLTFKFPSIDEMNSYNTGDPSVYVLQIFSSTVNDTHPLQIRKVKCEFGNKATDWTPAPEDIDASMESVYTVATQTADKFNWLVASGTSSTDFTLTDRMAKLTADIISLNGNVKVDGNMIVDGAITSNKLAIGDFTNLVDVNPDVYNPRNYTIVTDDDGVKWFKFGSDDTLGYYSIYMKYLPANTIFNKGDKYLFRALVKASMVTSMGFRLRVFYSDGASPTYTNMASTYHNNLSTEQEYVQIEFTVNTLPTPGRPIRNIGVFLETLNTKLGTIYVRELTVYRMANNVLIADGAITADKVDVTDLFAQNIQVNGTFTATGSAWIPPGKEDLDILRSAIAGETTLTTAQKTAFDFDVNGKADIVDFAIAKLSLLRDDDIPTKYPNYNPVNSNINVVINPKNPKKIIDITATNSFGRDVDIFFGMDGLNVPSIDTGYIDCYTIRSQDDVIANSGSDNETSLASLNNINNMIKVLHNGTVTAASDGTITLTFDADTWGKKISRMGVMVVQINDNTGNHHGCVAVPYMNNSSTWGTSGDNIFSMYANGGAINTVKVTRSSDRSTQVKITPNTSNVYASKTVAVRMFCLSLGIA